MGIRCATPIEEVDSYLDMVANIVQSEILRALSYLGEQCIRRIRDRTGEESWFDQTGNLRSSIGYGIYDHGKKFIESAFPVIKKGSEGSQEGKKQLELLASKYAETYALVVVAGMNYADFVEAHDNKDVLATTELWAKAEVKRYLDNAAQRALAKIAQL